MKNNVVRTGTNPDSFGAKVIDQVRLPWQTPVVKAFHVSKTLANTHPGPTYDLHYSVSDS
jgi:hypothetical protein